MSKKHIRLPTCGIVLLAALFFGLLLLGHGRYAESRASSRQLASFTVSRATLTACLIASNNTAWVNDDTFRFTADASSFMTWRRDGLTSVVVPLVTNSEHRTEHRHSSISPTPIPREYAMKLFAAFRPAENDVPGP